MIGLFQSEKLAPFAYFPQDPNALVSVDLVCIGAFGGTVVGSVEMTRREFFAKYPVNGYSAGESVSVALADALS